MSPSNPLRTVSPRIALYSRIIVHPSGIYINHTNVIVANSFAHFGTDEMKYQGGDSLQSDSSLSGANVWVAIDEEAAQGMVVEYREMRGLGLCEDVFDISDTIVECLSDCALYDDDYNYWQGG